MSVDITSQRRLFSLSEAQQLLPLLTKLTSHHYEQLKPVQNRMDRMLSNDPRRAHWEREFEAQVSAWRGKVERLGAKAAALWVVEFDVGEGCLSWKYPELKIAYFRLERDTMRRKLSEYIEERDPDWAL